MEIGTSHVKYILLLNQTFKNTFILKCVNLRMKSSHNSHISLKSVPPEGFLYT